MSEQTPACAICKSAYAVGKIGKIHICYDCYDETDPRLVALHVRIEELVAERDLLKVENRILDIRDSIIDENHRLKAKLERVRKCERQRVFSYGLGPEVYIEPLPEPPAEHADLIGWLGAAEKFLLDAAPNQEEIPYRGAEACHNAKLTIEAQDKQIAELEAENERLKNGIGLARENLILRAGHKTFCIFL